MPRHGHPTAPTPTPTPPTPQPAVHHVVDVNLNLNVAGLADLFGGAGVAGKLDQILSLVTSQDTNMADLKADLKGLKSDVATLHGAVTSTVGRINDLTAMVADLKAKEQANPSDDPEVGQAIADLHDEVTSMGGELSAAGQAVTPPTDTGTATTPAEGGAPA